MTAYITIINIKNELYTISHIDSYYYYTSITSLLLLLFRCISSLSYYEMDGRFQLFEISCGTSANLKKRKISVHVFVYTAKCNTILRFMNTLFFNMFKKNYTYVKTLLLYLQAQPYLFFLFEHFSMPSFRFIF